ncbi:M28 family peptidase [Glaciecola sp. MH2013]|uniref:M28 family metallopeptidase n=1 Tax=Glaciecola sp. MH2013 TaxID=2785524 RepID=UPI0018A0BD06|nr:M28 family peptidase [Glaciecola sp. MH2013]MBF7074416.1 M28 family peptidase [Glaciecola sp. MH2013]
MKFTTKLRRRALKSGAVLLFSSLILSCTQQPNVQTKKETYTAWQDFLSLADFIEDKGDRTAGTELEAETANWIAQQWESLGYEVKRLPFEFNLQGERLSSQNLSIDIPGKSSELLIVGAHYDSVGTNTGSKGLIDNGSGVAALISLARLLKDESLPYTTRLIVFGAEERGLIGSKAYVNRDDIDLKNIRGMINLDTIIGGDKLYVHSAHSTPYKCEAIKELNYNSASVLREGIRAASMQSFPDSPHLLHAAFEAYPEGETGPWSDHSPFACAGVEIAYIEATNFNINGKDGNDGYSQAADKAYWDCFDEENLTSCDRPNEKAWGQIWHTKFDQRAALFPVMKDKLQAQQEQNVETLGVFLKDAAGFMSR